MPLNSRYARRIRARRIAEQGGRCLYCRRRFTKTGPTRPTIEHLKPRMKGGKDWVANLAAACFHCNQHRGRQQQQTRQRALARARAAGPDATA
jgi:5-methylcytosine-specific restriction endonuclease McrA